MKGIPTQQRVDEAKRRRQQIYDLLRDVAAQGVPCPSSAEIARAIGCSQYLITHDIFRMSAEGQFTSRRVGRTREIVFPDGVTITPDASWIAIRNAVAAAFDTPVYKIVAAGRKGRVVRVRKAVAWVMRARGISTLQIGRLMGGKDHSSVVHYLRAAEILRKRDADFRAITDAVLEDRPPPRPVVRKPAPKKRPVQLVPEYTGPVYSWCDQCQSRVADERAMRCASRWCSLKAAA